MTNTELTKAFIDKLNTTKQISVDQIPNIDLYMDQVTTFMDNHLADMRRYDTDKVLTKTMINNYAKNHLLPPPVNKKYTQDHIILLIYIYYLKSFLSISDIQTMLKPISDICADPENPLDMKTLYTEIFSNYREESYRMMKDIAHKLDVSTNFHSELEGHQKEELQKFTYISLLAFDIYMKKQLMESIVDDIAAQAEAQSSKKDKGKHKHE